MDGIINDIFREYQVRKSKAQKTDFIEYTTRKATEEGYSVKVEKDTFGARNIVVGDPDSAKIIFAAHYDTCARLPFPNFLTPKNFGIYLLYNIAIVIGFFAVTFVCGLIFGIIGTLLGTDFFVTELFIELIYFGLLALLFFGPANKTTANDNTSGVTVLFGIMKSLPPELRDRVAIVFFDLEEMGLIGSGSFAKKHKNVRDNTLLVNFDCVSDGRDIMVLTKNKASKYSELMADVFKDNGDLTVDVTTKAFYPSDQAKFKMGVGVAAFNRTKGGMLYMDKIHTAKDTVYRRENIDYLVERSVALADAAE